MKKMLAGILASVLLCSAGAVGMTASATDTSGIRLDLELSLIYRIKAGTTVAEVKAEMATYATDWCDYALKNVKDRNGNLVSDDALVGTGFTGDMRSPKLSYFTMSVIGDLNGDGKVNVSDQVMLKNYIADGAPGTDWAKHKAADVDGNGTVNTSDLMALKNLIMAG